MLASRINSKSLVPLALLAVVFLVGGLFVRSRDQKGIEDAQCRAAVTGRADQRATWQEVRRYLLRTQPESQHRRTNEFIEGVLAVIPSLECIAGEPQEVER